MFDMRITQPVRLRELFDVPQDETPWARYKYTPSFQRNGVSSGLTPDRLRATFRSLGKSLRPLDERGRALAHMFGLYMVASSVPVPALYVGIAAGDSLHPEGFLKRIRKHRVKLTGSHIGVEPDRNGGVRHTKGWAEFAPRRARQLNGNDACEDVRVLLGQLRRPGQFELAVQSKTWLEHFESCICSNIQGLGDHINRLLWPEYTERYILLTTMHRSLPTLPLTATVTLWDNAVIPI